MLLNVIDGLPRNTHYGQAIALDEDLAGELEAAQSEAGSQARPSMREWSPETELLAAIYDRLNSVIQIQSEKDLKLKPWPGPLTAVELLRQYRRGEQRSRLERLITEAQQRYVEEGGAS